MEFPEACPRANVSTDPQTTLWVLGYLLPSSDVIHLPCSMFLSSLSSCNKYYLNIGMSIEFASHIFPFTHLILTRIYYLITHCVPFFISGNCLSYLKDQIYLMLAVFSMFQANWKDNIYSLITLALQKCLRQNKKFMLAQ